MALPAYDREEAFFEKGLHTEEEYFAWEEGKPDRWEFLPDGTFDDNGRRLGIIRAMSGGTHEHAAIAANLITGFNVELRRVGRGNCRPYGSDLKVHCPDGRNTYPDVTVACQPLQLYQGRRDIILNPVLIAEVLSPSTALDDDGSKRRTYQEIPSLQYYLLVAADTHRVEMYTREEPAWRYQVWTDPESHLPLPELGISIRVGNQYIQVDLL